MNRLLYIIYAVLLFSKPSLCKKQTDRSSSRDNTSDAPVYEVIIKQTGVSQKAIVNISRAGDGDTREYGDAQNRAFHFVNFNFKGTTTITVTKKRSSAIKATVLPGRAAIGAIKAVTANGGKQVVFTIDRPGYLSVEFDDDPGHKDALMIFADTAEKSSLVPNKTASNVLLIGDGQSIPGTIDLQKTVVYFTSGVHTIGYWNIPANIGQVYLENGALVKGYFYANRNNGSPLTINGRGILSNQGWGFHYPVTTTSEDDYKKWYKTIEIRGGSGHLIEGITIVNSTSYNIIFTADNVQIRNVKINGFRWNNDAITITGKNTIIDHCFIMANDDAIIPYGSGLSVTNSIFWQLTNGSVFQLGWNVHSMSGNNTISDCDVLHAEWHNPGNENIGFINAMNAMNNGNGQVIENFTVAGIYFDTPILRFLDIRSARRAGNQDEQKTRSWTYRNFKFKDIYLKQNGQNALVPLIFLSGDGQRDMISGFSFQNIYINGSKMLNISDKRWGAISNLHSADVKLF